MKRTIIITAVLLMVQVGLVAYSLSMSSRYETFSPDGTLFNFSPGSISSITLQGKDDKILELGKVDGVWQVTQPNSIPIAKGQVEQLLEKLAKVKESLAVATTDEALERFKVDKENFENRIIVKQGEEKVVDLYGGTSSGFKHIHSRVAGEKKVLNLPFTSVEFSAAIEDWIDKNMLQVKQEELVKFKTAGFTLEKKEDRWLLNDLEEEQTANEEEIVVFIDKISNLTIKGISTEKEVSDITKKPPQITYTLTLEKGEEITYSFYSTDKGYYILNVSGHPQYFQVQDWLGTDISTVNKEKFLKIEPAKG